MLKLREYPALPCFIRDINDLENEEWIDVLDYDGMYHVSNYGRVKSVGRFCNAGKGSQRWVKEIILKQWAKPSFPCSVVLACDGRRKTFEVATLVYYAFLREKQAGDVVCHLNKNSHDNRLPNLVVTSNSISSEINYKRGVQVNWGIEQVHQKIKENNLANYGIFEGGALVGKICSICNMERALDDFYRGYICKYCVFAKMGVSAVGKLTNQVNLAKSGLRYCSICKQLKSLDTDFGKNKGSFMGKTNSCKACVKILNEKYRNLRRNK